jgi:hypothetical protein
VDDLRSVLRNILSRIGRPELPVQGDGFDERLSSLDSRLSEQEREQRSIAARLKLLEIQADPRGLRHDC